MAAVNITRRQLGHRLLAVGLGCAALAVAPAGRADGRDDHERARRAFEAGEVMPLRVLLEQVERTYPGQVLEVELEREGGRWVYELKLLRGGGEMLELELDARDGTLLKLKGRDVRPERGHGERR
ncbi:PepSY domain-containing protein [Thauera mechernichensis]